jgi:hypothetical protein
MEQTSPMNFCSAFSRPTTAAITLHQCHLHHRSRKSRQRVNLKHKKNDSQAAPCRNGLLARLILICFVVVLSVPAFAQQFSFGYQGGSTNVGPLSSGFPISNPAWINVSGQGFGYYAIEVSQNVVNDGISQGRNSTVGIGTNSFSRTQDGIDNTYHFNPATVTLPGTGGSTNVLVTSAVPGSGVSVSVTSGGAWLTAYMSSPYTGQSFNLSATANVTNDGVTLPRTGTVQVNNETYTVTQTGVDNTYHFSPATLTLPGTGGSTNILVTSAVLGSGVTLSFASTANWLSGYMLGGLDGGSGPITGGKLVLNTAGNVSNDFVTLPRATYLQVNNESYIVSQAGIDNTYSFSPVTVTFPATGGSTNVLVTSAVLGSPVTLDFTSTSNWLTGGFCNVFGCHDPDGYTGGALTLQATANVVNGGVTQPRSTYLQVNNEFYIVAQEGTATLQVTITGHVNCSCDGSPIAGASVVIGNNSTTSAGDGSYSITNSLSPGTYPVTASGAFYSTVTNSITISSFSPATGDFTLTPNGTDPTLLNEIAPSWSIIKYTRNNGTGIEADFRPVNVTISVAACRLGFAHFNWIQEATGAGYNNQFCNCPEHPGAWFNDPPQYLCDGSITRLEDPNKKQEEWPTDSLPFYWNEGTSSSDPYNVINHTHTSALSFGDSPNTDLFAGGVPADFVTSLVGVRADGTYQYLRTFAWSSTYSLFGIVGDVNILSASLLNITNGTGGVTNIQNDLLPSDIPPDAFSLMTQGGCNFPVAVQPTAQSVVSGGSVTFAIFPTNSSSPLNYQWRKNGTNISSATNLTLQLPNVTTNDAANYDAILSDTNGSIGSAPATLTVLNAPLFQSPVVTTNGFVLSWAAAQGKIYQLQYKTNLNQTNWVNVGSTITSSNTLLSATNATGSDKQRFYRVQ